MKSIEQLLIKMPNSMKKCMIYS